MIITSMSRVLILVSVLGVLYFGLVILLLSTLTSDVNPVTEVASLYGIGPYAIEMNTGFFMGGIGMLAFAITIWSPSSGPYRSRVGAVLLFIAGLVLVMDSYFNTDPPAGPTTTHGIIHAFGGLFFFITGNLGLLTVARKFSRMRFLLTLTGVLVGFVLLADASLDAGGLAERLILLVIFASVIADALSLSLSPS